MENNEKRIIPCLLKITSWNVFRMLKLQYDEKAEIFERISYVEISPDNLNYPDLKLNADNHQIIRLRFNFYLDFLRQNFQLHGYINKRPYLIGKIVFERSDLSVLGFELEIMDAPQNRLMFCRFCPSDVYSRVLTGAYIDHFKNKKFFEEEFIGFYSSLVYM